MKDSLDAIFHNHLDLKICNLKLTLTVLAVCILLFTSASRVNGAQIQKGGLEYRENRNNYSALDIQNLMYEGNLYFNKALSSTKKNVRNSAFDKAMASYYLITKADNKNVYALTQIARIHDLKYEDKYAKKYYFQAANIEPGNPHLHYHFGEFYFKRDNLEKATIHYEISYRNGYENNFNLNCRLGMIYDKLGDLKRAREFYSRALQVNPNQQVLKNRIYKIDKLNYEDSEYYQFIRE